MARHSPHLAAVACVLGLAAVPAHAEPPGRSLVPASYPRWELGGGIGLFSLSTHDTAEPWNGWHHHAEFRADGGRYWTTHLKTAVGVSTTNQWSSYRSAPVPPGPPSSAYAYDRVDARLTAVTPAVTWQFRENTFVHPYVSAGAAIGVLREHVTRFASPDRASGISTAPPLERRRTSVLTRPFLAAGFKSYVNRAVFVRTEARAGFAGTGLRHVSLTAGIGVDF